MSLVDLEQLDCNVLGDTINEPLGLSFISCAGLCLE